jgi:hypothetical protein
MADLEMFDGATIGAAPETVQMLLARLRCSIHVVMDAWRRSAHADDLLIMVIALPEDRSVSTFVIDEVIGAEIVPLPEAHAIAILGPRSEAVADVFAKKYPMVASPAREAEGAFSEGRHAWVVVGPIEGPEVCLLVRFEERLLRTGPIVTSRGGQA